MFWPGSEAVIGGRQATYWRDFDDDLPNSARVNQLLEWLKLPDGKRPSFLTLYFSDLDNAGHSFGPDAEQTREAALSVDRSVGDLVAGVAAAGLADRVNYVIVSDHGMAALSRDRMIVVDDYIDPATADIIDWAPVLGLAPKDGDVEKMYAALKDKHPHLQVYRRDEIPAVYGLAGHPRVSPIVGIADEGWYITSRTETGALGPARARLARRHARLRRAREVDAGPVHCRRPAAASAAWSSSRSRTFTSTT